MSLYRNEISPNRQSFPYTPPILQPLGYTLDSSPTNRRREINSLKDLRRELRVETSFQRLFVVHSLDPRVLDVLDVNTGDRRRRVREGGGVWMWEYPNTDTQTSLKFSTISLFQKESHWILLVESSAQERNPRPPPPKLKHQDAATRASALRTTSYHNNAPTQSTTLEEDLCRAFSDEQSPLEEVLGELVFERWLMFLDCLADKDCTWRKERVLYPALQSLERNQDFVRWLGKHSQVLTTPSHQDISDTLTRLHRHILLLPSPQRPSSSSSEPSSSASDRALDRISYLGGLLLPITVVSSVLAIEGDYGPEGNNFWVFWVASAVASVVAIGLIHVDQVRGVEVWREVAEEFGIAGFGEIEGEGDESGVRDGHGLIWKRKQLGWGGAVKKVSGYYRVRGMKGLKFDRPDMAGTR